jgi:predicted phage tail protein
MTTIYLTGRLGQLFGKEWKLDVFSPAEAVRAININTKGKFRDYLEKNKNKFYKIAVQNKKNLLDKEELENRSGHSDIYVMPALKGSSSGIGKILAGVALIALTFVTFGGTAPLLAGGFLGLSASSALTIGIGLGASLILGGITQLLTPTPNFNTNPGDNSEDRQSTLFQGNAASIYQGGSVGLIYGRALVAPMPICISAGTADVSTTASTSIGSVEVRDLNGGGEEYIHER